MKVPPFFAAYTNAFPDLLKTPLGCMISSTLKELFEMYKGDNFRIIDKETFEFRMPEGRPIKILQLSDLHLGFGWMARNLDRKAMEDVTTIVERTKPDLIVFTGDSIFPFFFRTGTKNNKKQAAKFMEFMDMFRIPYALVMGNHDAEIGARLNREQLGNEFRKGDYSIFMCGPKGMYAYEESELKPLGLRPRRLRRELAGAAGTAMADKRFWSSSK